MNMSMVIMGRVLMRLAMILIVGAPRSETHTRKAGRGRGHARDRVHCECLTECCEKTFRFDQQQPSAQRNNEEVARSLDPANRIAHHFGSRAEKNRRNPHDADRDERLDQCGYQREYNTAPPNRITS
jgi:hypothetical protein